MYHAGFGQAVNKMVGGDALPWTHLWPNLSYQISSRSPFQLAQLQSIFSGHPFGLRTSFLPSLLSLFTALFCARVVDVGGKSFNTWAVFSLLCSLLISFYNVLSTSLIVYVCTWDMKLGLLDIPGRSPSQILLTFLMFNCNCLTSSHSFWPFRYWSELLPADCVCLGLSDWLQMTLLLKPGS